MPKIHRPNKFQLCLSDEEWQRTEIIARQEGMTRSNLFRLKTIYTRLPRQITKVAAATYWLVAHLSNNCNQIAKALNTLTKAGCTSQVDSALLEELRFLLQQNLEAMKRVGREIAEFDLLAQLDDSESDLEESEVEGDWEAN